VNTQEELFALDAIDELTKALPRLQAAICVWKPGPTWNGFCGTPVDALSRALMDATAPPDIYVCGPPALVEAAEASALAAGVARDRIFSEKFSPA
jgi:ferredoxin-NADP reductase